MIGVSNITNRTDPNSLKSRVFVGNLNTLHIQKPELEAIFSKYGAIIGISVHKGYAFIQYANEANARAAVRTEDMNTYYGMKLDVTIASEPKNRKRGRPVAAQSACAPAPNFLDLLQAQALAAVGGQFSQLGFVNNKSLPLSSHYPPTPSSGAGIMPTFSVMNTSLTPLIGAPKISSNKAFGGHSHRNTSTNTTPTSAAASSSAKRTRLETSGLQVTSSQGVGLLSGASTARSANFASLVVPKPETIVSSSNKTSPSADAPVCILSNAIVSESSSTNVFSSKASASVKHTPSISIKLPGVSVSNGDEVENYHKEPDLHSYVDSQYNSAFLDDILICGQCRNLFDNVDGLIAHKMAGCSITKEKTLNCRCKESGEPDSLDCAYCHDNFVNAWELVSHCHTEHGLTIYAISSRTSTASAQSSCQELSRPTSPKRKLVDCGFLAKSPLQKPTTELSGNNERVSMVSSSAFEGANEQNTEEESEVVSCGEFGLSIDDVHSGKENDNTQITESRLTKDEDALSRHVVTNHGHGIQMPNDDLNKSDEECNKKQNEDGNASEPTILLHSEISNETGETSNGPHILAESPDFHIVGETERFLVTEYLRRHKLRKYSVDDSNDCSTADRTCFGCSHSLKTPKATNTDYWCAECKRLLCVECFFVYHTGENF